MCDLYERITALCKQKGVTGSRMCLELGLSKSTLSDIKSGRKKGLSTANAQKIASYLGVSIEYLLGQKAEIAPTETGERFVDMSDVDIAFYGGYKELDEDDQKTIRDMVQLMRARRAGQEK